MGIPQEVQTFFLVLIVCIGTYLVASLILKLIDWFYFRQAKPKKSRCPKTPTTVVVIGSEQDYRYALRYHRKAKFIIWVNPNYFNLP